MDMRGISPLELLAFPPIFLEGDRAAYAYATPHSRSRDRGVNNILYAKSRSDDVRPMSRDLWHVRLAAGCGVAPPSQKPHMQRDAQATQLHAEVSRLAAYPPFLPLAL